MAIEKVTYKEPKSYFSPAMRKADKEYDKQLKAEKNAATSSKKKKAGSDE